MARAEKHQRRKRRDRVVMDLSDFTPNDLDRLSRSEPPEEAAQFDNEYPRQPLADLPRDG